MKKARQQLTIELVPQSCWFSNVRDHVDRSVWDVLRKDVYRQYGSRCAICGGVGPKWPVECHERWHYDEKRRIQTLKGLIALCPACHEVKHIGLASVRGRLPQARAHLMKVNQWCGDRADNCIQEAFAVWARRNTLDWSLDLSWLEQHGVVVEEKR